MEHFYDIEKYDRYTFLYSNNPTDMVTLKKCLEYIQPNEAKLYYNADDMVNFKTWLNDRKNMGGDR